MEEVTPKSRLIYESYTTYAREALVPGQDFVYISFNHGRSVGEQTDWFWGDTFFAKNNLSVIGIVDRRVGWFVPDDIEKIAEIIRPWIKGRKVITYGTSMGGYGAAKFSRILGAYRAMVFAPQAGINPKDVGAFDAHWSSHYPSTQGGGEIITPDEVGGEIFTFYDPGEVPDKFHVQKIKEVVAESSSAQFFPVIAPFTWHGPIFQLSDTVSRGRTAQLLEMMRRDKITTKEIRQLYRETRIESNHYRDTRRMVLTGRLTNGKGEFLKPLLSDLEFLPTSQESRITRLCLDWMQGRREGLIEAMEKEIADDQLWSTSLWALDRITALMRTYKLRELEKPMRYCFFERGNRKDEIFHLAHALHDLDYAEEAEEAVINYLKENPKDLIERRGRFMELGKKLNMPAIHDYACQIKLLAETTHIQAYRIGQNTSQTVAVIFVEGPLSDIEGQFLFHPAALVKQMELVGHDVICVLSPARFPAAEMAKISNTLREYAAGKNIITAGEWWGSYAALRYAKLLKAELAFGIRYVQDNAPLHLPEGAEELEVSTPALRSEDLVPRSFVLCGHEDPHLAADLVKSTNCKHIPVSFMGWDVGKALFESGEETATQFLSLLGTPEQATQGALRQVIRAGRRSNGPYQEALKWHLLGRFSARPWNSGLLRQILSSSEDQYERLCVALLQHMAGEEAEAEQTLKAALENLGEFECIRAYQLYSHVWAKGQEKVRQVGETQGLTQVFELLRASQIWDSRKPEEAQKILTRELRRDGLKATSETGLTFVRKQMRSRHQTGLEKFLRVGLFEVLNEEKQAHEIYGLIDFLTEVEGPEEAVQMALKFFTDHPERTPEVRHRILEMADRFDSQELRACATHTVVLGRTKNILAFRKGDNTSSSVAVVFREAPLERPDMLAVHCSALDYLTEANGIETICVCSPIRFPIEEMKEIAAIIQKEAAGRPIVTLGEQWGGYFALRYSALLKAQWALSMRYMREDAPLKIQQEDGSVLEIATPPIGPDELAPHAFIMCDPNEYPEKDLAQELLTRTHTQRILAHFMWSMPLRALLESGDDTRKRFLDLIREPEKMSHGVFRKILRDNRLASRQYCDVMRGILLARFRAGPWNSRVLREMLLSTGDRNELFCLALLYHLDGQDSAARATMARALEGVQEQDIQAVLPMYKKWPAGAAKLQEHLTSVS